MSGALKKRILFVLGGPGAGKGTQCSKLVEKYGFVHLSAGDLLREERQSGSVNGELIDRMIKEGQIVPVKITLTLLQQAMTKSGRDLFLIDGFPRNFDNLQGWKEEMAEDEFQVEGVLFYDCPESVMEERLLERGKTSGRTDDNAEAIRKRFHTYLESTMPVIDYYAKLNKVFKVDATPGPDDVFEATQTFIDPIVNVE
uniref:UMP-CMP kinase n=1 Tax=Globisporangium ultimum (strain ATCC 200006 / CBS 805.95 / DAOM BR144) TaxID=431595 RepID=K3XB08_GLOUD